MPTERTGTGRSTTFFDDPPEITLAGAGTNHYFDSQDGIGAAVAPAGHGRIRYNDTTKTWQVSMDGGAYASLSTGGGGGGWDLTGNLLSADGILGNTDTSSVAVRFYNKNLEAFRIEPTYLNTLFGRTTNWDENGLGGQNKYILQMQREQDQSTYCTIINRTDGTHSTVGYDAVSINAEILIGVFAPLASFGDLRTGNDAYIQAGTVPNAAGQINRLVIFTEAGAANVPILLAPNGIPVITLNQNGSAQGLITTSATLNFDGGDINFTKPVTTSDYLSLNSKPQLRGVASPDGGQNSIETTACHLQLGKGISDSATLRGLLFQKNDGTVFGEFGAYHNGTPQIQFYLGGLSGSHIMYDMTNDGTKKMAWFGATPVARGAAIADASGGATVDAEARTAINALLAVQRAYNLIAT